jgi:capsular exopolysaccharide synthesis family protein
MNEKYDFQNFSQELKNQKTRLLSSIDSDTSGDVDEELLKISWIFEVLRRRFPIIVGAFLFLTIAIGSSIVWKSKQVVPVYKGSFQLLVEPLTAEDVLNRLYSQARTQKETGVADLANGARITRDSSMDYLSLILVLRSPNIMSQVVESLKDDYPEVNHVYLLKYLSVDRITIAIKGLPEPKGTKILEVVYTDENPEKIQKVLDVIADIYVNYSREQRQASLNQGIDFIQKKLPAMEKRVEEIQTKLQMLRQEYKTIDPNFSSQELSRKIRETSLERLRSEAELREKQELYSLLQNLFVTQNYNAILSKDTKTYNGLLLESQKIETEIALNSARLLENSLPMQALREKQKNIDRLLAKEAEKVLEGLKIEVQSLNLSYQTLLDTENSLKNQLVTFPQFLKEYEKLQQQLKIAYDLSNEFEIKQETLLIDAAQKENPWEIITPPHVHTNEKGKPISIQNSQTKRQLALAIILNMLLSLGIGFLIEMLHTVFHKPEEIKTATKLPLLGAIPWTKKLKKVSQTLAPVEAFVGLAPRSFSLPNYNSNSDSLSDSKVWEAFRSLYTNICLLSSNTPIQSLVIGSAMPGDGKSTVAVNLAQTAATIGRRVLLVDADLRNPKIHTKLGLQNLRGLTEAINTDISLNDAIQRSPNENNLFILTSGQLPEDPVKLLSSKKMRYLMEQFQAFFDLVIYDTPPLMGIADSSLIAANTDGMMLVVQIEKTDRSILMKTLEGLKISGNSALGIVANGVKA